MARLYTYEGGDRAKRSAFDVYSGSGSPEGVQTGNVGDLYVRLTGGAATTLYVKESGTGNTGWVGYGSGGTYLGPSKEDFDVGGGGATNFDCTTIAFGDSDNIDVYINGDLKRKGGSYDFTVPQANRVHFAYTVPQYAWVRVVKY